MAKGDEEGGRGEEKKTRRGAKTRDKRAGG